MNGASEATLQDLLVVAQAMNANLVGLNRLISKSGGGSGGGGSGGGGGGMSVPPLGPAGIAANVALGGLKVATGAVSAVFGVLGSIVGKTINGLTATVGNLYSFAKAAAEGRAKLSDFYDAFRDLPFFIGNIAGLAADIIRYQEGMLSSYVTMTRAGATFAGSLTVMRDLATRGFMSLEEMTRIVRANSEVFSTMGGDVDKGITKFIDVQNRLMGPGSQYSRQLLGMGFSFEDVGNMIGLMFRQQGDMTKSQFRDHAKLSEAVFNSAKELDLFSRATGKQREELEKEQKKLALDAAFNTFTQGISDPKTRERVIQAVSRTTAMAGEDAGALIKQMFMTGGEVAVPLTEGAQNLAVTLGAQGEPLLRAIYDATLDPAMSSVDVLKAQMASFYGMGRAFKDNLVDPLGKTGAYLSLMNNGMINQLKLMELSLKVGNISQEAFVGQAEAAEKNQEATNRQAAALLQAQRNIQIFGQQIMNIVNTLVGPIAGYLIQFGNTITSTLTPMLTKISTWFINTFGEIQDAFNEDGWEGLFRKIAEKLEEAWKNTKDFFEPLVAAIKPRLEKFWNDITPTLLRGIETMLDFIIYALRKNSFIARMLFGETEREQKEGREKEYRSGILAAQLKKFQDDLAVNPGNIDLQRLVILAAEELNKAIDEFEPVATRSALRVPVPTFEPPKRHSGTLGMTGNWWEKETQTVQVQAGETVATPGQLAQIVDAAGQKGLPDSLQALNSTMRTLIAISQRIEENTKETVRATRSLTNDAFQMV